MLAGGIEQSCRHLVPQTAAVAGGEVLQRLHDIAEADARSLEQARSIDSGRDQDGVVAAPDLGQTRIAADLETRVKDHAAGLEQSVPAGDDPLVELEIGDAVDEEPADPVVAIVDMDLIALAAQLFGGSEAARSGADDRDRLRPFSRRGGGLDPAAIPGGVGDVFLDRTDRDG